MTSSPAPAAPADGRLPGRYFAFAHGCLLTACFALVADPRSIAGFYYHPKMVAIVHLVTLGWISSSILGSLYLIAPMTLGVSLPRRRLDAWAFWSYLVGTAGMVTHFWIDEPNGMIWSAAMVILGFGWVTGRFALGLRAARRPPEIKLHFYLAFTNLALAAGLGVLVGLDKVAPTLDGASLLNVMAHAHLAALGWVLMVVMGAGYRLLPMLLPAAAPSGAAVWLGAAMLEIGALGLAGSFLFRPALVGVFGLFALAAIGVFLSRLVWMLGHRRPTGRSSRQPDYPRRQVFAAFAALAATAVLALGLLFGPAGEWKLAASLAYGTLGLVGFFGQLISGVSGRIVPVQAYLDAPIADGCSRTTPPPAQLPPLWLERLVFWLWTPAVPLLALALALDWIPGVRVAALLLAGGVASGLAAQRLARRRAQGARARR